MGQWYRTDKQTGNREPVPQQAVEYALCAVYGKAVFTLVTQVQATGEVLSDSDALYDYKEDR